MIVTSIFFTEYSPLLRVIFVHFWCHFSFSENHLMFSHEILYICCWYYSDCYYTENNILCFALLCWGPYWDILGPILVCDLVYLGNCSISFHEILCRFLKSLWPLFMYWVQPGLNNWHMLWKYVHLLLLGIRMTLDMYTLTIFCLMIFETFQKFSFSYNFILFKNLLLYIWHLSCLFYLRRGRFVIVYICFKETSFSNFL